MMMHVARMKITNRLYWNWTCLWLCISW